MLSRRGITFMSIYMLLQYFLYTMNVANQVLEGHIQTT